MSCVYYIFVCIHYSFNELIHASFYYSSVASSDSTAQTGNQNNGDWQEEVYQEVLWLKVFTVMVMCPKSSEPSLEYWYEYGFLFLIN